MKKLLASLLMALAAALPTVAQTAPPTADQLINITGPGVGTAGDGSDGGGASGDAGEEHGLGFWVETRVAGNNKPAEAVVYFDKMMSDRVGFYAQMVKDSAGYASVYAGPKFKVIEGVEAGIGVGREVLERHAHSTIVRNAWVSVTQEQFSLYATIERGAAGTWHKEFAMYKLTDKVNVGVMHETGSGSGPRVEYAVTKDIQAWVALLGGKPMMAVNFAF